jgi:hypothetical protein
MQMGVKEPMKHMYNFMIFKIKFAVLNTSLRLSSRRLVLLQPEFEVIMNLRNFGKYSDPSPNAEVGGVIVARCRNFLWETEDFVNARLWASHDIKYIYLDTKSLHSAWITDAASFIVFNNM